jgi:organic radical activating enzyme/predicted transposase YbfD/YdcC
MTNAETKAKLDKIGCGFCLAKWTQVTMHLGMGMTHSCHHPSPHKVPLTELKRNPTALHNTSFKKKVRKEMLDGKRPKECNYCWNVEDNSNSFSDRVFKSSEPWSRDQYDIIKDSHWRKDYNPRYVEVSFSNTCNFKCAYCGPQYSSKWVEEIEKHGPYKTKFNFNDISNMRASNTMPYKQTEHNPYVEAFWKWWPDLFPDLHTFRITGGEPLLSKDTFKVLEYIQENFDQNSNLSLAINSNLGVPDSLIDKFINVAKDLCENNKVRELNIFTSIEAESKQAEYTRYGLDADKFWKNIDKILTELPKVTINIMATYNALSVFTYDQVIEKTFELKRKHANGQRYWISALQLDTSYLRWPEHLSVKIIPKEHLNLILEQAKKMLYYGIKVFDHNNYGFSNVEIQKIKRIYDYAKSESNFDVEGNRKDFVKFVDELDRRRGTDFLTTFPQLKELYAEYKER